MKRTALFAVVALFAATVSARADFTTGMLARWTFNNTSSEATAFTDDVAGIQFKKGVFGSDGIFQLNPSGSVQLGGAVALVADQINSSSERFAKLGDSATIYCRIKYGEPSDLAFNFGLVNATAPGDWAQLILTELSTPNGIAVRAKGAGKQEAGMASGHLPPKQNDWSDVAIIFDGKAKKVRLYVDGKMAERGAPMAQLDAFQSLMVGRLKQSNARRIEVDEVRVYDSALPAEWIAEIEPVPAGSARADFTTGMLARWTFNNTSSEATAFTDDVAGIQFKKGVFGSDGAFQLNPSGSVQLGAGVALVADQINSSSERFAKLGDSATIYCRIKYGEPSDLAFNFGLVNATAPGDWAQLILTELSTPNGIAVRAKGAGKQEAGMASGHLPPKQNDWSDVAIIFDGKAKKVRLYVDGKMAERGAPMAQLDAFQSLMVGRLKQSNARRIEVDEVRVYDSALPAEWIAEIESVPSGASASSGTASAPGRLVIEDFSDVGTWRTWTLANITKTRWFGADLVLGGIPDDSRDDGYAGLIRFDFADASKTGRIDFQRAKASLPEVFADGVEFDADSNGVPGRFAFTLEDGAGKQFRTETVALGEAGWKHYRSAITQSGFTPPYKLLKINFEVDGVAGKGELRIDDIALTGTVSRQRTISIRPVLADLANDPGQPLRPSYRLRNAAPEEVTGEVTVKLYDGADRCVAEAAQQVTLPPLGAEVVSFELPPQAIGSYHADVQFQSERYKTDYLDWLAVFRPNNGRKNSTPMWFGIQDTVIWNGEGENALHNQWKKLAGFDLERFGITGNRIDNDGVTNFPAIRRYLEDYEKLGMIACVSYTEGVPSYTQKELKTRGAPTDLEAFRRHMNLVFECIEPYGSVHYFEFWNEPDLDFYNGTLDEYLAALRVVHDARDAVAPAVKITTGGVTIMHPREKKNFSRDTYALGKGLYDIACFHAHGSLMNYVERQEKVEQWLKDAGVDVPICNTETGDRGGYAADTIRRQAGTLARKIIYAKSRNTEFYTWFTLQDYWDMDPNADDSFGLVNSDNRPKPAFVAYNELIRQLGDTRRGERLTADGTLDVYRFLSLDGKRETLAIWPSVAGTRRLLALEGNGELAAVDMYGKPIPAEVRHGYVAIPVDEVTYVSFPAGAFRIGSAVATQPRIAGGAPGKMAAVEIEVRNPFEEAAELHCGGNVTTLKAGENSTVTLEVPIPADAPNGMLAQEEKLTLKAGNDQLELIVPVTVNVCYPVAQGAKWSEEIQLNTLERVNEMTFDPNIPRWLGPDDLSCAFAMTHQDGTLKIDIRVTDDRHVMNSDPENGWRDDSIQIGFASLDGKYTEVTLSGKADGDGVGAVFAHSVVKEEFLGQWTVPCRIVREGKITHYQAELPLEKLGIADEPGTLFRFAFLVNENDGKGRIRWMEWMGGIGRAKNPDEFGWGCLE